ncbi:hypothetical protein RM555_27235 [Micromonospora sp. DSM 115977]|uniref:Uncharacterized protein n=1 Tax=Micromonospora reichwaldensis TaxID=3075516 RepID=A0ABU2X3E2_9ACTN|nr:hypothetical protein [Micromonospora sp. DSM 115977]MDT0532697.1 hypothetical protein [Micromonospora sp. DSM 115977]
MTTSRARHSAADGLASAEGDIVRNVDTPRRLPYDDGIAGCEVRMAPVSPPGMRSQADAA